MEQYLGDCIDDRLPWVRHLTLLDEAWALPRAGARSAGLASRGQQLGASLRDGPKVVSVRTLPVSKAPYPVRFAFNGAAAGPGRYLVIFNKSLLVQLQTEAGLKNLLFNPTDPVGSFQAPFFHQFGARLPGWAMRLAGPHETRVAQQLQALGLGLEDIDLIAFDHLHVQDLRPIMKRFPRALLLASRREWEDWDDLHPMQRSFYVADGKQGVPMDRVVLTDADLRLGEGCVLLRTPGHTSGNQTLFVHGADGVFGCSENGTCVDSWTPRASRIPGVARFAEEYGLDVVLNANTPELGGAQYTSMLLERNVVDRVPEAPDFVQMFCSSEIWPSPLAPRVRPTVRLKQRVHGEVRHAR